MEVPVSHKLKKNKILIVDDEPSNVTILANALYGDYDLIVATSGREALECATYEIPPDLILLDIIMPGMDGYEVIKKLKADIRTKEIPVIFITVMDKDTDEAKGFELGAVDYIPKPFSTATINARIQTHLELKHYRDYLEQMIHERTEKLGISNRRLREEITERTRSEGALRESEERYRLITDNSYDLISEFDENGNFMYANARHTELLGYPPESLIDINVFEKIHPEDLPKMQNEFSRLIKSPGHSSQAILRFMNGNNVFIWLEIAGRTYRKSDGKVRLVTVARDITDRMKAEREFKKARNIIKIEERMHSLARMASGITKSMQAPLSGIRANIKIFEENTNKDKENRSEIINNFKLECRKIEDIILNLIGIFKPAKPVFTKTDVIRLIQETTAIFSPKLRQLGITMETELNPQMPICLLDSRGISQVLSVLIENAAEALNGFSGIKKILIQALYEDDTLIISVIDSGPGIPEDSRDKVFDPFYTTKKNGIGLGLCRAYRIIADHAGTIHLTNSSIGGAQFTFRIPKPYQQFWITDFSKNRQDTSMGVSEK